MEWRRVHEDLPKTSTSGGQSEGGPRAAPLDPLVKLLPTDEKSANDVHERHLLFG